MSVVTGNANRGPRLAGIARRCISGCNQLSYQPSLSSLKALCKNDIEGDQEQRCEWCPLARATGPRWPRPSRRRWRHRAARWGWRNRPTRRVVVAYPAFMSGQPLLVAGRWLYRLRDGWWRADRQNCRRSRHECRSYIAPYTHGIPYRGRDVWLRCLRGQSAQHCRYIQNPRCHNRCHRC